MAVNTEPAPFGIYHLTVVPGDPAPGRRDDEAEGSDGDDGGAALPAGADARRSGGN